jgi:2,3-diketo-5-methylthio-1-phosphopentane phosphatase
MQLPPPSHSQVWLDFDGTITRRDLLDELILRHSVDDSWKQIERQWQAGEIGSRQCLEGQFALVRINDEQLETFLGEIELDPGLLPLLELLDRFNVPRAIVSDGVDRFIRHAMARHNIDIPIRSNAIERMGLEMKLVCPHSSANCLSAAAHCKCTTMKTLGKLPLKSIYVGDGRSDLCPSRQSDVVFAKNNLAKSLMIENRDFFPFTTLLDVKEALERQWAR